MSLVCLTMSKALVRFLELVNVLSWGQGSLNPWATLCARGRREVTVEWLGPKPFWLGERRGELSYGCRRRSKTSTIGQRKEIGR